MSEKRSEEGQERGGAVVRDRRGGRSRRGRMGGEGQEIRADWVRRRAVERLEERGHAHK
jgi:hypothetical protein